MYDSTLPSTLLPVPTPVLTPHMSEYPNSTRSNDSSSPPTPDLTRDELSPPSSADPITPHAEVTGWPSSESYPGLQGHVSSGFSSNKEAVQLGPQALPSSPSPNNVHNTPGPGWNDGDPLRPDGMPSFDNINLSSQDDPPLPHNDVKLAHESGPTFVEGLITRSPSAGAVPLTATYHPADPPLQGGNFVQSWPENTTPIAPLAWVSIGFPTDNGGSQQTYWTVDPFQTLTTNERPQGPASTYPPSLLQPVQDHLSVTLGFCLDTMPRQIYLHLLLRLPHLYFSRLTRIFRDAELSLPEMQKLALVSWAQRHGVMHHIPISAGPEFNPTHSDAFMNLKSNWEAFIESLMTEWKMNNIVSVLLLSAILTTLQIDGVSNDPIARNTALTSLVCGLMGLLYGCMYIVRFGTMRKGYKAIQWAEEAQQTKTRIFWNVWVFLAMPAVWLSWSIILFMASVMAYVWRTGSDHDPVLQISPTMALGPRLAVTGLFALGMLYFGLIIYTLRRYGDIMDEKWKKRVASWVKENIPREAYTRRSQLRNSQSMSMTAPFDQMPLPSPWATPSSAVPTLYHPSTPQYSPRHASQSLALQWNIPNFTPGSAPYYPSALQPMPQPGPWNFSPRRPDASPPTQPGYYRAGHSASSSPLAASQGIPLPISVRLPIEDSRPGPDPQALAPSPPAPGSQNIAVVMLEVYPRCPQLPLRGPTSGVRNLGNLENIYKAILPVVFAEPNPFKVGPVSPPQVTVSDAYTTTIRIMTLNRLANNVKSVPEGLDADKFTRRDWELFVTDMELAWRNQHPVKQIQPYMNSEYLPLSWYPRRHDFITCLLHWWNALYFSGRGTEAFLCEEFSSDSPWTTTYAIYLAAYDIQRTRLMMREKFKHLTVAGLQMINIYPPFDPTTPNLVLAAESVLLNAPPVSKQSSISPFQAIRMTTLGRPADNVAALPSLPVPSKLGGRNVDANAWNHFITSMQNNWIHEEYIDLNLCGSWECMPQFTSFCEQLLDAWNIDCFRPLNMEALLCREISSSGSSYAIYLTDRSTKLPEVARFEAPPPGITRIEVFYLDDHGPPTWVTTESSSNTRTSPRVRFQDEIRSQPAPHFGFQ